MKKSIISGLLGILCLQATAQNDIDALRYTGKKFGSTAKSMSIAGAVGSLGADASSASVNPAGLAQFKNGEFSMSVGFINSKNTSTYLGNTLADNTFKMNIPNLGLVFANKTYTKKDEKGWKNYTVAFNMARVNDFNRVVNFEGTNTSSSFMDYFAERASGFSVNQIRATDDDFDNGFASETTMAWESYLFDSIGDRQYAANASPIFHDINQKSIAEQSGRMNEFNFSLAGNYNNFLYLGATLSYTTVRFNEVRRHTETNDPRVNTPFSINNFTYSESLKTTGGGFSGRLGMVVRANDYFRFGLSMQTPQILNLDDTYDFGIVSTLQNGNNFDYESKKGNYSYSILTPASYTGSASVIFGKRGFISADVENIDYSAMRLRSTDKNTAMENANDVIRKNYTSAINYRVGGELVLDNIRLRGGYANYGSPLIKNDEATNRSEFFTGGIGLKEKNWSLDLGIVQHLKNDVYQPYVLNDPLKPAVSANNKFSANSVILTLISRF
jgi:hypothetical protein